MHYAQAHNSFLYWLKTKWAQNVQQCKGIAELTRQKRTQRREKIKRKGINAIHISNKEIPLQCVWMRNFFFGGNVTFAII